MQNKILMYIGIIAAILPFIISVVIVLILRVMKSTGKEFPSTTKDRIKTSVLGVIISVLNLSVAVFLFYHGWMSIPIIIIVTTLLLYMIKHQSNRLMNQNNAEI